MERRRPRVALLGLVAVAAAVLGGFAALGIAGATGWLDSTETVIVERALPEGGDAPSTAVSAAKPLDGDRFDPAAIYRGRSAGVVTIYALFDGHGDAGAVAQAQGSGFVTSNEGYILTNSHVITTAGEGAVGAEIEAASTVFVEFRDGDRVGAEIVGWDVFNDVGVLSVDPDDHALAPVPLGDSSSVVVGEPVAAIGSPFGQVSSLAVGVVSAVGRSVSSLTSVYDVVDVIQTDAPINRGNSGGPLFDARGRVIGINAQIRSESGNAEGVGFAIPINAARRSLEQLVETGRVRYAWLGVSTQTVTASVADALGYELEGGAAIQTVVAGSPAAEAGLRAGGDVVRVEGLEFVRGGDVVVAINGRPVRTTEDLVRIVAGELYPGEKAEFTIVRGGDRMVVPVVLRERPTDPDAG
jgi:S1-C subfamily serine protease